MDNSILPIDTWQVILEKLGINSQLRLKQVCKLLYEELKIYNFEKIKYSDLLTDEVIKQHPYIKTLNLTHILDLSNLKCLDSLYINTTIPKNFLDNMDIRKIEFLTYCVKKGETVNLNHMTKLKSLKLFNNEVNDISNLNLTELTLGRQFNFTITHLTNLQKLNICRSSKIKNISHLTNLTTLILNASINNSELTNLNLTTLKMYGTTDVTNFLHMTNLTKLNLNCGSMTINLNSLLNLKILYIAYMNKIMLHDIKKLSNLEELHANSCPQLTYFNCFTKLKVLNIDYNDCITSNGISKLCNLRELYAEGCSKLTNLNYFTNLKKLNITYCKITNKDISKLELEELYHKKNITKVNSAKLKIINGVKLIK